MLKSFTPEGVCKEKICSMCVCLCLWFVYIAVND